MKSNEGKKSKPFHQFITVNVLSAFVGERVPYYAYAYAYIFIDFDSRAIQF